MKILVTGAKGFVGARIIENVEGAAASVSMRNYSEDQIKAYVDQIAPDMIVHTAAISDMATCQQNPDASYEANVLFPMRLVKATPDCKHILFSSDQVYNGCDQTELLVEADAVHPSNVYGNHKLEMEEKILQLDPDAVLLRATWMYDLPLYQGDNRSNFIMNIMKGALERKLVPFSDTAYRSVTYVREVANAIGKMKDLPGGAYNFGSESSLTMYQTAIRLTEMMGIDPSIIKRTTGGKSLSMNCSKLKENGIVLPDVIAGLKQCLDDYNLNKGVTFPEE